MDNLELRKGVAFMHEETVWEKISKHIDYQINNKEHLFENIESKIIKDVSYLNYVTHTREWIEYLWDPFLATNIKDIIVNIKLFSKGVISYEMSMQQFKDMSIDWWDKRELYNRMSWVIRGICFNGIWQEELFNAKSDLHMIFYKY